MRVFFYPQARLRDRQLATVRAWPRADVVNFQQLSDNVGSQVARKVALHRKVSIAWPQRIPLINVKRRPPGLAPEVAVYVWGALVATGPFIVDLDNPFALTGYNLRALYLYRPLLRAILASRRCVAIRCMSRACVSSLEALFGKTVSGKATVCYPSAGLSAAAAGDVRVERDCRFLFVSTQFEIKGGAALLRAFRAVLDQVPTARLDMVTHLPAEYEPLVQACSGAVQIHAAEFSREELATRFMSVADVLVHPTYVDSFGMVALEALAAGLGLIVTDVYALPELVTPDNGFVLPAPVSIWNGYLPSRDYYRLRDIKQRIHATDTAAFERQLTTAMVRFATDPAFRHSARRASADLFAQRFQAEESPSCGSPS